MILTEAEYRAWRNGPADLYCEHCGAKLVFEVSRTEVGFNRRTGDRVYKEVDSIKSLSGKSAQNHNDHVRTLGTYEIHCIGKRSK